MRIKFLDGLKGLGAIMVYLSHYSLMNYSLPSWFKEGYVSSVFFNGGKAVGLFLIISGFLAWLSADRKTHNYKSISQMVVNRYFRFAIPFGIVFIILYATYFMGIYSWHTEAGYITKSTILQTAFWPVNIIGFIKSVILSPVNPDFWDAPLWMMKYVFLGTYIALLLQLAIKGVDNKKRIYILLFCSVVLTLLDKFYLGIMIGQILAFLFGKYGKNFHKSSQPALGVFFICLFLLLCYKTFLPISTEIKNFLWAMILVMAVYTTPFLQKLFESDIMQKLGKISFSMFIWHWPILCSLTSLLCVKTQFQPFYVAFTIQFGVTSFAVIIISYLSQKFIESMLSTKLIHFIDHKLFD